MDWAKIDSNKLAKSSWSLGWVGPELRRVFTMAITLPGPPCVHGGLYMTRTAIITPHRDANGAAWHKPYFGRSGQSL